MQPELEQPLVVGGPRLKLVADPQPSPELCERESTVREREQNRSRESERERERKSDHIPSNGGDGFIRWPAVPWWLN
jgi:hypothetical protein